jgi:hypothetical protein
MLFILEPISFFGRLWKKRHLTREPEIIGEVINNYEIAQPDK